MDTKKDKKNKTKKAAPVKGIRKKNVGKDEKQSLLLEEDIEIIENDTKTDLPESADEIEDNSEFIKEIKTFEKNHLHTNLKSVFVLVGNPKIKKETDLDKDSLKEEYARLISLLDEKSIIVHFQNEYPLTEKYRFITEEIFNQQVEDIADTHLHINFIYEEFHPELDEDEDEDF